MIKLTTVLMAGAVAALPIALWSTTTHAQPASPGVVLYDAAGGPVAVLRWLKPGWPRQPAPPAAFAPPGAAEPFAASFGNLFAQQEAILAHMMDEMRALTSPMLTAPDAGRAMEIGFPQPGSPGMARTTEVVSISNGHGVCTQTITYADPGNGAEPRVTVHKVGDACGVIGLPRPAPAAQPTPLPGERPLMRPAPAQPGSKIIKVEYRRPSLAG